MDTEQLLEWLREEGWHVSDGVDTCSGTDEEYEKESAERLAKLLALNSKQ